MGDRQRPDSTPANVEEAHAFMRDELIERFGAGRRSISDFSTAVRSMRDNAADLLAIANVNGLLVGGHSLKAVDFLAIYGAFEAAVRLKVSLAWIPISKGLGIDVSLM